MLCLVQNFSTSCWLLWYLLIIGLQQGNDSFVNSKFTTLERTSGARILILFVQIYGIIIGNSVTFSHSVDRRFKETHPN
jgi:hypothetical protein